MKIAERRSLETLPLPGRLLQKAVGADSSIVTSTMTVGFARYCPEAGPMEPHHHAEETVVVLDAQNAFVRRGEVKDRLEARIPLSPHMVMHFAEDEWHVFEYDEDGFLDILFIYGSTDNIRPEEKVSTESFRPMRV